MKKKLSILGSTGSIGLNTLKIVSHLKDQFEVTYLSTNTNSELLVQQIKKFKPKAVCIVNEQAYEVVKNQINNSDIKILFGRKGLLELSKREDVDIMLNGLVGAAGMEPTLCAIESGVDVALANKESLVMAGDIITKAMKKTGANIFPVDSEHSALWQCMVGERLSDINRIILTGSGGPFRERPIDTFEKITVEDALNHPNWDMGNKITIDSATMMNKGLEVIEAYWLFGFNAEKIDIVVHPQSIIHSMIEMKDGAIKAQMGVPDMKVPIQYALTFPNHLSAPWERLNFFDCGDLTFEKPDYERFPLIKIAYKALEMSGSASAALNLANDYSVHRFLKKGINFNKISLINKSVLENHPWIQKPSLEDISDLNEWVKNYVNCF